MAGTITSEWDWCAMKPHPGLSLCTEWPGGLADIEGYFMCNLWGTSSIKQDWVLEYLR